ncbi:MAG: tyrosine--tRNA ligase [Clostridiaceae bacterium]
MDNRLFDEVRKVAVEIYSEEGLKEKLNSGKKLKIKLGADPSRPDLHLGHSVPLRMLKKLQDEGHEIIFIIGDFTGMIGDPTGRSKTRVPLTFEQTRINGQSYFDQVSKILDVKKASIRYNSEWLSKLNFADVLELAGKYTLARIMERDDFTERYKSNKAIGLHELFYPLMQGYDSIALEADIEVGGTDQTFNLLVGRELQKSWGQQPQEVITFPLLPGLDGVEKMSKSLDNYIGIDEAPEIMFEKCMKVPDTVLEDYFRLTTDIPVDVYKHLLESDIREAHFVYGKEIVRMYHGIESVLPAVERYESIANGAAPEELDIFTPNKNPITLVEVLKEVGFAASNSDARRLIESKGIKFDGDTVSDTSALITKNGVLSRGKNKFIKIEF